MATDLTATDVMAPAHAEEVRVASDAAGRVRLTVPWLRGSVARAVAVEDSVERRLAGVRAVQAVNAAGLAVSAAGALSPVLAAILHNASSIAVVANSSRAARYQLDALPRYPRARR